MASPKRVKNGTIGTGRISRVIAVAWLVFGWSQLALSDEQPHLKLAPINLDSFVDGSLGYSYLRNTYQNDSQTLKTTQHELDVGVLVGLRARTFIWQPWIARLYGYIGLSTSAVTVNTTTDTDTTATKSGNQVVTGSTALHVLPQSRFPFRAEVYRDTNKATGFLSGVNSTFISQGFSLSQSYRSLNHKHSSVVSYAQNTSGKPELGAESAYNQLNLSLTSQPTLSQTFQLIGTMNNTERPTRGDHFLSDTLVVTHNYLPNPEVSVGSLVNLLKTNLTTQGITQQQNDFTSQQLYSFASWRPADTPLTVTGSARLLRSSSRNNGVDGVQVGDTNFNLGANYAWSPFLRVYGSVNINDNSGIQTINTNAAIAAQKGFGERFDPMNVGGFRYTRSIGASLSNQTITTTDSNQVTTTNSAQTLGLSLGHALDNDTQFGSGRLRTNLNQGLATVLSSNVGAPVTRLTHGASLSWNHTENTGTTMSRLSANDSRTLSGNQNFFQLINLQASRDEKVGFNQSLIGNLTIQASRSGTSDISTPLIASPSADVNYHHERFFKVKNMTFDSILKIIGSDIVLSQNQASQNQPTLNSSNVSWDNNISYFIGLLKLRLNTHLAEVNKTTQTSLLFTITRTF